MSRWPDDEDEHALSGEEVELSGRRVLPFDFDNSDCEGSGLDDELQSFLPADLGQSADPYFGGKGFAMTFGSQGVGGERAPALCAQENVPFDVLGGSRTSHSLLATSSPFHVMEEDDDTNDAWPRFNFTERADYVGEVGEAGYYEMRCRHRR